MAMPTSFVLYSRSYCHLCDDMLLALARCAGVRPYAVQVVDVDMDPTFLERYDELVPVLMGRHDDGALQQLCHYFLDDGIVTAFFATSPVTRYGA